MKEYIKVVMVVASLLSLLVGCDEGEEDPMGLFYNDHHGLRMNSGSTATEKKEVVPNVPHVFWVVYSNDDNAHIDRFVMTVDGIQVANFRPADTGDWGHGWYNPASNAFIYTPLNDVITVTVSTPSTDSFGFWLWYVNIVRQ